MRREKTILNILWIFFNENKTVNVEKDMKQIPILTNKQIFLSGIPKHKLVFCKAFTSNLHTKCKQTQCKLRLQFAFCVYTKLFPGSSSKYFPRTITSSLRVD